MVIKKYVAKTEQEAVALAKAELGKDAVIMNVRENKPKGLVKLFRKSSVEITAAIDEILPESEGVVPVSQAENVGKPDFSQLQKAILQQEKSEEKKQFSQTKHSSADILQEDVGKTLTSNVPKALEQKLNTLQDLLEKQLGDQEEMVLDPETAVEDKNEAYLQLIRTQLTNNEVESTYVEQIIDDIQGALGKETTLDNLLASVYQKIVLKLGQAQLIDVHSNHTKFIFFIGPTGVGKTTTIAKIASMLKLSRKSKVALITCDTYRISAVEQLKTYANILGIPLKVVYSSDEIGKTMDEVSDYDLVLVDTAGRSHNNLEQKEDLHHLLEKVPDSNREVFLVLSATTKYKDLVRISQTYSEITKYNLIFTKLDETDTVGNIYNIRMLTGAPLSYMTWGQNVPDDIGKIDAQKIAKQLLGGNS